MRLTDAFPPSAGTLIGDKYVVTEHIGSGGMGVVVAARHQGLGQLVAIKLLHPELAASPEIVGRFLREARATSRLKSEHAVGVSDVGTLGSGLPYFVMEHLTGTDLLTLLGRSGPLGIEQVLDYTLQALEAIAEAHRHGIVHRDLKPANLLLTTREDDSDFIKVLDFGTSKLTRSETTLDQVLTRTGSLLGSPLYMAPEQIRDARDADARSDIWSLGVTMHELLTGFPPFAGRHLAEIIRAVCDEDYAIPARDDLPAELAEILRRCLMKEPEARFQSVPELARAFYPLICTVASQVSIERILRLPSSAPPPRPDAITWPLGTALDLGGAPGSLVQAPPRPSSIPPSAREARDSSPPEGRRATRVYAALGALAAAGLVTYANVGGSSSRGAAQPASRAPVSLVEPASAAPAPVPPPDPAGDARRPERPSTVSHATRVHPHASTARAPAPAASSSAGEPSRASTPSVPARGAAPAASGLRRGAPRALDGENPFAE